MAGFFTTTEDDKRRALGMALRAFPEMGKSTEQINILMVEVQNAQDRDTEFYWRIQLQDELQIVELQLADDPKYRDVLAGLRKVLAENDEALKKIYKEISQEPSLMERYEMLEFGSSRYDKVQVSRMIRMMKHHQQVDAREGFKEMVNEAIRECSAKQLFRVTIMTGEEFDEPMKIEVPSIDVGSSDSKKANSDFKVECDALAENLATEFDASMQAMMQKVIREFSAIENKRERDIRDRFSDLLTTTVTTDSVYQFTEHQLVDELMYRRGLEEMLKELLEAQDKSGIAGLKQAGEDHMASRLQRVIPGYSPSQRPKVNYFSDEEMELLELMRDSNMREILRVGHFLTVHGATQEAIRSIDRLMSSVGLETAYDPTESRQSSMRSHRSDDDPMLASPALSGRASPDFSGRVSPVSEDGRLRTPTLEEAKKMMQRQADESLSDSEGSQKRRRRRRRKSHSLSPTDSMRSDVSKDPGSLSSASSTRSVNAPEFRDAWIAVQKALAVIASHERKMDLPAMTFEELLVIRGFRYQLLREFENLAQCYNENVKLFDKDQCLSIERQLAKLLVLNQAGIDTVELEMAVRMQAEYLKEAKTELPSYGVESEPSQSELNKGR